MLQLKAKEGSIILMSFEVARVGSHNYTCNSKLRSIKGHEFESPFSDKKKN